MPEGGPMATVTLNWDHVEFDAEDVSGWVSFRRAVDIRSHKTLLSSRAVYVIRIMRPYSFDYGNKHSPVAYIGKGNAQQRITSHLKSWIPRLSSTIRGLRIRIYFCTPVVRYHGTVCEHVEADLIRRFENVYGHRPLRNLVSPTQWGKHYYTSSDLQVLHPRQGPGYHWALRPLPSSKFFREM
jgi:hypothetical protein